MSCIRRLQPQSTASLQVNVHIPARRSRKSRPHKLVLSHKAIKRRRTLTFLQRNDIGTPAQYFQHHSPALILRRQPFRRLRRLLPTSNIPCRHPQNTWQLVPSSCTLVTTGRHSRPSQRTRRTLWPQRRPCAKHSQNFPTRKLTAKNSLNIPLTSACHLRTQVRKNRPKSSAKIRHKSRPARIESRLTPRSSHAT